jgi:hypothetical protein
MIAKSVLPTFLAVALGCVLVIPGIGDPAAETTIVEQVPVVPAEERCGMVFNLTGTVKTTTHLTQTSSGVFSVTSQRNYQGVTATSTSPDGTTTYRAVGSSVDHISDNGQVNEFTIVDNFQLIGEGSAPNLSARAVIHTTVHADGTVSSEVVKVCIVCPDGSSCDL